jgi:hypothetical protein
MRDALENLEILRQEINDRRADVARLTAERDAASATLRLVRSMVEHERGVRDQVTRGGQSTGESPRMGVQMLRDLERALGADDGRYLQEQWAKLEAERDAAIAKAHDRLGRQRLGAHMHGVDVCAYCAAGDIAVVEVEKLRAEVAEERAAYQREHVARVGADEQVDALRAELRTMLTPCEHARLMAEASDPALREEIGRLTKERDESFPNCRGDSAGDHARHGQGPV